jgi:hypothetical protein
VSNIPGGQPMKKQQLPQEINNKKYSGDILTLRLVDFAAQAAILISLFAFLEWSGASALLITFCIFLFWFIFCCTVCKKNLNDQLKFQGNIGELTYILNSKLGLSLQRKVGKHYIYSTKNRIIPNIEYIVNDHGKHCVINLPSINFLSLNDSRFEIIENNTRAK